MKKGRNAGAQYEIRPRESRRNAGRRDRRQRTVAFARPCAGEQRERDLAKVFDDRGANRGTSAIA